MTKKSTKIIVVILGILTGLGINLTHLYQNADYSKAKTSSIASKETVSTISNSDLAENTDKEKDVDSTSSSSINNTNENRHYSKSTNFSPVVGTSAVSSTIYNDSSYQSKTDRVVTIPTSENLIYIESKFTELVNNERKLYGTSPLIVEDKLNDAAKIRASEITNKYNHLRPNGDVFSTAIKQVEYGVPYYTTYYTNGIKFEGTVFDYGSAGENFTSCSHINNWYTETMPGFSASKDELDYVAEYLFEQFKSSSPHYKAILDSCFIKTGVGVVAKIFNENDINNKSIRFYCVQLFTTK